MASRLRHAAPSHCERQPGEPPLRSSLRERPDRPLSPSESLHDVLVRLLPYWYDQIIPDLRTGATVLISAHGNGLRALCKHLDHIPDDAIEHLDLPTGAPLLYELDSAMTPIEQLSTLDRTVLDRTVLDRTVSAQTAT